jgi:hypothetical protein
MDKVVAKDFFFKMWKEENFKQNKNNNGFGDYGGFCSSRTTKKWIK